MLSLRSCRILSAQNAAPEAPRIALWDAATPRRKHLEMAVAWLGLPQSPPWLNTLDMLRTYEGRAAQAYFAAWVGLPLRWAKPDAKRIPPHWLTIQERTSPLAPNGNGRLAVDPVNAILNYAYAVLEGQCRQALTAPGFDVACGFSPCRQGGPRQPRLRPDGALSPSGRRAGAGFLGANCVPPR